MIDGEKLRERLNHQSRIAVIGDVMVDQYLWGNVSRISPEAPVPIVEIDKEQIRPGGSANVAVNLVELSDHTRILGVVGRDEAGESLRQLLNKSGINMDGLFSVTDRPTTVKTRIIGGSQQLARVDKESREPVSDDIARQILRELKKCISSIDAILLEDYNKGVLTEYLIREIITLARENKVIVTVDPKKDNFFNFKGVSLFKPNRTEAENAVGFALDSEESINKAGFLLLKELHCQYLLITLGSKGMALFENGQEPFYLETQAKDVADVSGAGDTVISVLTSLLAAGADIKAAVMAANIAAGISVAHVGVVRVTADQILERLSHA